MDEIAPVMLRFAKAASVPVCVHLDHGTDVDYIKRGLELGFTSVMYDGSVLAQEENIANTKRKVIALGIRKINYYTYMAKSGGTAVEAMPDKTFFHDIEVVAMKSMKENVKEAIGIFAKGGSIER